jgi:hypothetical protein
MSQQEETGRMRVQSDEAPIEPVRVTARPSVPSPRVHDSGRAKEGPARPRPELPMGDYRPIRHLSDPTEVAPLDDSTAT